MVMNVAGALNAYRQGGGLAGQASATTQSGGGASFTDALKDFAGDATKALEQGEQAAAAAGNGKADISSVVTAMNNAELMLQTVVAIRDKVISAYQDITKTAI